MVNGGLVVLHLVQGKSHRLQEVKCSMGVTTPFRKIKEKYVDDCKAASTSTVPTCLSAHASSRASTSVAWTATPQGFCIIHHRSGTGDFCVTRSTAHSVLTVAA